MSGDGRFQPYTPEQRAAAFWSKVAFNGPVPAHRPELGPCALWIGARWGRFTERGLAWFDGRRQLAHRVAWQLTHGPIPDGLGVLHSCDVELCVVHLFVGTQAANMADAAAKGRTARGDRTATAKLAPEVVRTIRARYAAGGVTQRELAAGLNVSERAINAALSRETWAWVE